MTTTNPPSRTVRCSLFARLFAWLGRAMGDGDNPSSSRLIAVPSLLAAYLVPLAVWGFLSLKAGTLLQVPPSVLGLIGSITGPLLTFVHWQKREEGRQ